MAAIPLATAGSAHMSSDSGTFETELDKLFCEAIDAQDDTLWYSETTTLMEAILHLYARYHEA